MENNIDKRMNTFWMKSNQALKNYQNKLDPSKNINLNYVDLLYISNFKGGNATFNELEQEVNNKLKDYSAGFIAIRCLFGERSLNELSESEVDDLIELVGEVIDLCANIDTKIDGLGPSYLSALLHAHFPNLIPILDRRVLINLKLVAGEDLYPNGQVKCIEHHYATLIKEFWIKLPRGWTIREFDKTLFTAPIKSKKSS